MVRDGVVTAALVCALQNVFGTMNADRIMKYLEKENVVEREAVNMEKLETALRDLFGQGSTTVMHSLLMVQNKSISRSLR